ncbi:MAG: glycosyl hydrolase family 2, partial [Acidobacteria bacterium]
MTSTPHSKSLSILLVLVLLTSMAMGQKRITLKDGWMIRSSAEVKQPGELVSTGQFQPTGWYATSVPSTVVAALVRNKVYEDPHFGMNLRKMPGVGYPIGQNFANIPMPEDSPFKPSWWYRTEFSLPAGTRGQTPWLHFDGINFRANVWLNGRRLADSRQVAGAWRTYQFDVSEVAKPGEKNVLAVEVFAPTPQDLAVTFVDWNPTPPDKMMGLFRDVYLTTTGPVSVRYPQVITRLNPPALDEATLKVNVELRNASDQAVKGTAKGTIEKIEFSRPLELGPRETKTVSFDASSFPQLVMSHPRVWWPTALGQQPLYTLTVDFLVNGKVSDRQAIRFGIREVTSEFNPQGHRVFKINGRNILIRGAGYTPEMLLRSSPERQEAEIAYVKHMNLNTIRLEGKLEDDQFLETCDREGILLMPGWCCCDHWEKWKDWDDEDHSVAAQSLESQIRRLRSHPSVFVWFNGSDNPPPARVEQMYLDILKKLDWPNPVVSSAT